MSDSKQAVLTALKKAGKPLKAGDLEKLSGVPKAEVAKAIETLKKEGKITSPKRCFYAAS